MSRKKKDPVSEVIFGSLKLTGTIAKTSYKIYKSLQQKAERTASEQLRLQREAERIQQRQLKELERENKRLFLENIRNEREREKAKKQYEKKLQTDLKEKIKVHKELRQILIQDYINIGLQQGTKWTGNHSNI